MASPPTLPDSVSLLLKTKPKPVNKVVGRIVTSSWINERGIHSKKEFIFLKRLSSGHNFIQDEDWEYIIKNIVNWNTVSDGTYEIIVINVSHDCESGIVDGWEYQLIPYKDETK